MIGLRADLPGVIMNQPIDKGRVTFVAEVYQTAQGDKKRYAPLGRATKWPAEQGKGESITIELDAIPVGHTGTLNLFIFWDSEQQPVQPAQQYQQPNYNPGYQPGYQQQQQGYKR